ncbi:MAG: transporter substrate-binding domain-containing protein [Pseudomonadota bacterium]
MLTHTDFAKHIIRHAWIWAILVFMAVVSAGCLKATTIDPLTQEERAWLSAHDGKIRLAHDPNARPIEFIDTNGVFRGLAADYVQLIESRLNFRFDIVHLKSWDEALSKAKNKEVDVLCAFTKNAQRETWMLFTEPYIVVPTVILVRDDTPGAMSLDRMKDRRVTFTKGWIIDDYLRQQHPDLNMLPAIDPDAALSDLITGKADAWVTALTIASIKIEDNKITNIRVAGETPLSFKLSMASRKDWPVLNNILKKGLALISEQERSHIFKKWINIKQQSIFENRQFWIIAFSIFAVAILPVIVVYYWNNSLKRKVMQKTQALETELREREKAEAALLESEAFLDTLLNAMPIPVFYQDRFGRCLGFNNAFERFFCEAKQLRIGKSVYDRFPAEVAAVCREKDEALIKTGGDQHHELQVTNAQGELRVVILHTAAFTDSLGAINGLIGAILDITAHKRSEDTLRYREQLLNEMGSIAKVGGWEHDLTTGQVSWTKETYKILEVESGPVPEPEAILNYFISGDRTRFEEAYRRAIKNGEPFDLELRCTTAMGRQFWGHAIGRPEFKSGKCIKMRGTFQDITDQKEMEARLQKAQKMEAIGNLAGGIAHDFNNILFPIVGLSEMLTEDLPPGSPEHENAGEILKAAIRGSELVKQILAFSRQSEHQLTPVRLQQIVKEVLKLARSILPSNIEIRQDIQNDCGLVMADPTQLHQIAMNLVTNAFHAIGPNSGTISITLKETRLESDGGLSSFLEPGQYALLAVSDTGCGIDPAVMDKIFEPYFTTKPKDKGTGLGLAVVYGIVKALRGDIKAYSEMGQGTVLNVYLPLLEKFSEAETAAPVKINPTGTERILIVDDEKAIVQLQTKALERLGYRVTSRSSSVEALEAFRSNSGAYDLVISDMTMPGMTGDDLAKALIQIRPDIPVIICTGFSERINKNRIQAAGIKGVLMKPVIKSDLAALVRKVLDDAKG